MADMNDDDDDAPELDEAFFARARPMREALPAEAQKAFKPRGAQKAPVKKPVSIRLSKPVLDYYQSLGPRWQTRLNADLETLVHKKRA